MFVFQAEKTESFSLQNGIRVIKLSIDSVSFNKRNSTLQDFDDCVYVTDRICLLWTFLHRLDLKIWRFVISSAVGFTGVRNFKYPISCFLGCACCLISVSSWFFFLIRGMFQAVFLCFVFSFKCFYSSFPVTTLGLICSQSHISASYCFYGTQLLRIHRSKGSTRLPSSLLEDGSTAGSLNVMFFFF